MKRKYLAFVVVLLVLMQAISGCGKTIVITQTEILTIPGPVTTTTQTINITGPVTTTTQTTTVPAPVTTTTLTTTVPGPTTTVTQIQTIIPTTQGVTYIVSLIPASPSTLHFNEKVNITFDYVITDPGGAYIFARPMTKGGLTPYYGAHGSPLYTPGKGTGSGFFTISQNPVTVDQIRFQIWNSNQTVLLCESFVSVNYSFIT